jgi:ankyrin repeat protein
MHGGLSPLQHAAMNGDIEVVACLVTHGANPNLKGLYGNTPLHEAALKTTEKKLKIVDILLIAGATPNIQNDLGQTPLHFHRSNSAEQYEELAKMLIRAGAELQIADIKGNEPFDRLSEEQKGILIQYALHCRFGR